MGVVFYRRMPRFGYARAHSLAEVLELLDGELPVGSQIFVGGTDLLPKLKSRKLRPPARVIDLKGIAELDHLRFDTSSGLSIGALASVAAVGASHVVAEKYPALAQAARMIGANQIQNRASIVGNVCNALPSADSPPALLVHDATVTCFSRHGERKIPLADFFLGAGKTALAPGELVKHINLPPPLAGERSVYLKMAPRGRMDLAFVGVAVSAVIEDGAVRSVRIGLGSAAPTPMRAAAAEACLTGRRLDAAAIEEAARTVAAHAQTRSSHRASAEYRLMMLEVLTRRALNQLAA